MKNTKLLFGLLFLLSTMFAGAQEYCTTSPVGYGRAATGGAGGNISTVTTYSNLKSKLTSSSKEIILVSGTITIPSEGMISVKSNKTLIGLPGAKLLTNDMTARGSGILSLGNISNVIIRNLIFEGPGAYDVDGRDLISNTGCVNLWVDHCEFYDGLDGNFDNTNNADNITISWCVFGYKKAATSGGSGGSADHRFTNLIAASPENCPADGKFSITFQKCYWSDGCKSRMPRTRNGELHILNCLYDVSSGSNVSTTAMGLEAGINGTDCYVEGTYFKKVSKIYEKCTSTNSTYGNNAPNLTMVDCIQKSTASTVAISDGKTVSKPSYSYTAMPSSAVEAAIKNTCGAGATLSVNSGGVVSSPCQTPAAAIDKVEDNTGIFFKQTADEFAVSGIEVSDISIYATSGMKLDSAKGSSININTLNPDVYIALMHTTEGKVLVRKFIK